MSERPSATSDRGPLGQPPATNLIVVAAGDHRAQLRWHHNRFHYHPRVLRLAFSGFDQLPRPVLAQAAADALAQLRRQTESVDPLIFRATVPSASPLLAALREHGFLETRRVYQPVLDLEQPLPTDAPERATAVEGREVRLAAFSEAGDEERLHDLLAEVYGRTSRLDPATPEQLEPGELWEALTDELDPAPAISSCAFVGDELVGVCTIYAGDGPNEVELGLIGVKGALLTYHRVVTLALLGRSMEEARRVGKRTLRAEIDSDDPWTLYTFAELPFTPDEESVSLAWMPRWAHAARRPDSPHPR